MAISSAKCLEHCIYVCLVRKQKHIIALMEPSFRITVGYLSEIIQKAAFVCLSISIMHIVLQDGPCRQSNVTAVA